MDKAIDENDDEFNEKINVLTNQLGDVLIKEKPHVVVVLNALARLITSAFIQSHLPVEALIEQVQELYPIMKESIEFEKNLRAGIKK